MKLFYNEKKQALAAAEEGTQGQQTTPTPSTGDTSDPQADPTESTKEE